MKYIELIICVSYSSRKSMICKIVLKYYAQADTRDTIEGLGLNFAF